MPNVVNWVRWKLKSREPSKWHLMGDNPAFTETVCGEKVGYIRSGIRVVHEKKIQRFDSLPEDRFAVCMHCMRFREMKLREGDINA